jgi:hypothetical protein
LQVQVQCRKKAWFLGRIRGHFTERARDGVLGFPNPQPRCRVVPHNGDVVWRRQISASLLFSWNSKRGMYDWFVCRGMKMYDRSTSASRYPAFVNFYTITSVYPFQNWRYFDEVTKPFTNPKQSKRPMHRLYIGDSRSP